MKKSLYRLHTLKVVLAPNRKKAACVKETGTLRARRTRLRRDVNVFPTATMDGSCSKTKPTRPSCPPDFPHIVVPFSAPVHQRLRSLLRRDCLNFAARRTRTSERESAWQLIARGLTRSRSAPASISVTAASPCPDSIARCKGVLPSTTEAYSALTRFPGQVLRNSPARSIVFNRVLGRPSGGFKSN